MQRGGLRALGVGVEVGVDVGIRVTVGTFEARGGRAA